MLGTATSIEMGGNGFRAWKLEEGVFEKYCK